MPARKATTVASSSAQMLKRLHRLCPGEHEHQPLVSGRAAEAAFYPKGLIKAILRGIRDTADAEDPGETSEENALPIIAATMTAATLPGTRAAATATAMKARELEEKMSKASISFRHADGRRVSLKPQWKSCYNDEYTNEELPLPFIQEAMLDELLYFCDHVLVGVPASEAAAKGAPVIGTRWVNCSKQDRGNPKAREGG